MALDVSGSRATPLGRTHADEPTVLRIMGERPAWMRDGSCREHPEVDFFPERGGSLEGSTEVGFIKNWADPRGSWSSDKPGSSISSPS